MISMSLEEIAVAVSGEIFKGKPETLVSGVCDTDSRKIEPGGIFFAKLGESEDGHKYLVDAALSGAALAIVSTPKEDLETDQIVVADTVAALSKLAEAVLN
ncbi:MAG: UDP-N-acetylmuramoylalanyl-D-glutamate--2,6-diaminopimelate ligase, partial [Actinobacteria bacterium]|nr:UDP-N-acetylmuramoylalanyl-D-glutamate--2,6-diaminopimelate ligase [Actinomycetota bacterium]